MIRALYSLVMWGAQPFLRRKLRRRGTAEPGYVEHIEERFGRYLEPAEPGALWLHAVSLGETRAAAVLIDRLREQQPGLRILLTHGTATGRAEGQKLLQPGDAQAWLPWDTPQSVERDHPRRAPGMDNIQLVRPNGRVGQDDWGGTGRSGRCARRGHKRPSGTDGGVDLCYAGTGGIAG